MDTSFSSREQRIAILSILLVLALESVAFVAWTYYPSADMYYNELTTQNILEEGGLPEFDPTVFGGRHHLYPPLLDYHTAYLIQLTGATYLLLFRFLPFVILPVYFMLSFSLSGFFTKRSETRILASLLFVTVPFVTFQYASIHAGPTLGLLLSLFVFYAFLRHTRTQTLAPLVLLSLFSSLLLLTHLRSFILTYAVLTVFLLIQFLSKGTESKNVRRLSASLLAPLALCSPWLFSRSEFLTGLASPKNPFIDTRFTNEFVLSLFALFCVSLLAAWKYRGLVKRNLLLFLWAAVPVFLALVTFALGSSTYFRNLEYSVFPVMLFLATLFVHKVSGYRRIFRIPAYSSVVLLAVLQALTIFMAQPLLDDSDCVALQWLASQEEGVVLSDFAHAYAIPNLAGKQVVVGAFPESLPDGGERLQEVYTFFTTCDSSLRSMLLKKYDVKYIFVSNSERKLLECSEFLEGLDKKYDSGTVAIYGVAV